MLIKDFYSISSFSSTQEDIKAAIVLHREHEVYRGHFPGQPVVPGVIQIQILKELTEKALNRKLFISEVTVAKYLNMIVPSKELLQIEITLKADEKSHRIISIIKNDKIVYSKIKLRLSKPNAIAAE